MISKEEPLVSVVIPTYNRAYLIGRAIKSVLEQTYKNLEIIVVDDSSEDNTEKTVKSFNDSRIIFTRHEKNKGASAARNTGIKLCNGNYIAFQDSDDEWLPDKVRKQITVFLESSDESIGVVYSGFFKIKDNIKTYMPSWKYTNIKEGNIYFELLKDNLIYPTVAMVKKICFEKAGLFDENLSTLEDWELFIRISRFFKFKYIPEALALLYYTPNGVSERSEEHRLKTYNAIIDRNINTQVDFSLKYDNDGIIPEYEKLSLKGIYNLRGGNIVESKKCFEKALKMNPFNADALFCIGTFYLNENNLDKALEYFNFLLKNKLLKRKIHLSCLYNNLGVAYIKKKNKNEGYELIKKAKDLNPMYLDAKHNIEQLDNKTFDLKITRKLIM